jgi:hypothetical protein
LDDTDLPAALTKGDSGCAAFARTSACKPVEFERLVATIRRILASRK